MEDLKYGGYQLIMHVRKAALHGASLGSAVLLWDAAPELSTRTWKFSINLPVFRSLTTPPTDEHL